MKMNGMIYIAIFRYIAPNCIHSKEALHEAKVEFLEAEVEYLKFAVECRKAEVQFLKAEAKLLVAKTNRYDWFYECDHVCS